VHFGQNPEFLEDYLPWSSEVQEFIAIPGIVCEVYWRNALV